MALRSASGYDTEIEHLYGGETVTVTCSDGKPVEGPGIELQSAKEKCADENDSQSAGVRTFLLLAVLAAGWGIIELRKTKS